MVEDDFSNYLYRQGLNSFEYGVLQDQHSEEALSLLRKYSEQIFDRMVKNVKYLEYRSDKQLRAMECHQDYMVSIGIQIPEKSNLDLTNIQSLRKIEAEEFTAYKCSKSIYHYSGDRDQEIFTMIEAGCYVVDDSVFNQLNMLRNAFQN